MPRLLLASLVLAAFPALAQTVTITRKGMLLLKRDGVTLSQHTVEREAVEHAINAGPGTYRIVQPELEIVVKPDALPVGMSWTKSAWREAAWRNTLAWTAIPGNLERMRWPLTGMYLPSPMP